MPFKLKIAASISTASGGGNVATLGFSWTAPSAGGPTRTGYNFYKSTDGGSSYSVVATPAAGATSLSGVSGSAGDKFYIVPTNDAGEGDESNIVTAV